MELRGFEPLTPCMPCRCATSCATAPRPVVTGPPHPCGRWESLRRSVAQTLIGVPRPEFGGASCPDDWTADGRKPGTHVHPGAGATDIMTRMTRPADRYLLDGAWLPVTRAITFLAADAARSAQLMVDWRGAATARLTGATLQVRRVEGTLPELLSALLPLNLAVPTRYLFLPTRHPEPWTAFLDNNWQGTEAGSYATGFAAQPQGVRTVGLLDCPHTYDPATNRGDFGVRRAGDRRTRPRITVRVARRIGRVVQIDETGRRWELQPPTPEWPLPDPVDYSARRVADKLPQERLEQVADHFGLRMADEDFYAPDGWALVVEAVGGHTLPPNHRELTLEQAKANDPGR